MEGHHGAIEKQLAGVLGDDRGCCLWHAFPCPALRALPQAGAATAVPLLRGPGAWSLREIRQKRNATPCFEAAAESRFWRCQASLPAPRLLAVHNIANTASYQSSFNAIPGSSSLDCQSAGHF